MARLKNLTRLFLLVFVSANLFAASQSTLFISGGTIYTMAGPPIQDGVIRVEHGKITYVGRRLKIPPDVLVVDATGKVITPGFILANTHLGIGKELPPKSANLPPITPGYRALDIIHLDSPGFEEARIHGITSVNIMPPNDRPVPGVGVVMKTGGNDFRKRIVKNPSALSINLVTSYQPFKEFRGVGFSSEVADIVALRSHLSAAEAFRKSLESSQELNDSTRLNLSDKMFLKAINQEIPVMMTAESPTEIERGLSLAEDFDLKPVFVGVNSIDQLISRFRTNYRDLVVESAINTSSESKLPPISDALLTNLFQRNFRVQIAISQTGFEGIGAIRYYPLQAAMLQRLGVSVEQILKTLTVYPAEMLNLQERLGTIEVGKDADLVIFNEGPFTTRSLPDFVIIDGQILSEGRR